MFDCSKLVSMCYVSLSRIGDTLSYVFPKTACNKLKSSEQLQFKICSHFINILALFISVRGYICVWKGYTIYLFVFASSSGDD